MTDYTTLKALAEKAAVIDHNEVREWFTTEQLLDSGQHYPKNAAFIAAASPDVVLALIARVAELEGRIESINDDRNYIQGQLREALVKCTVLEKDAGRYRWLRNTARSVDWSQNIQITAQPKATAYQFNCRLTSLQMDAAIDAAMGAQA